MLVTYFCVVHKKNCASVSKSDQTYGIPTFGCEAFICGFA